MCGRALATVEASVAYGKNCWSSRRPAGRRAATDEGRRQGGAAGAVPRLDGVRPARARPGYGRCLFPGAGRRLLAICRTALAFPSGPHTRFMQNHMP